MLDFAARRATFPRDRPNLPKDGSATSRCRPWGKQHLRGSSTSSYGGDSHGNRNRQVVQRREGLRLHHPRGGQPRPVRPPLEHPGRRLSVTRGGREGVLRGGG